MFSETIEKAEDEEKEDGNKKRDKGKEKSLRNAGKIIGWLERSLILTFIILGEYEAVGLLVAAKAIFRYSELRRIGEYILIGTLLSFAIAIMVGLIARYLLYGHVIT